MATSWSKAKNQQQLKSIYGVDFPDTLFWLHEFIVRDPDDPIDLTDIDLYPSGPLALLIKFDDLSQAKFNSDPLLDCRYARDIPEFFTCIEGDYDGLHWGMLLDEPLVGFRGAAMYLSEDRSEMTVYQSLFDAILSECEDCIDSYEYQITLCDSEEEIEVCAERKYLSQRLKNELEIFLATKLLSRYESRPVGWKTTTGIDIILPDRFDRVRDKDAIEMLKLGRELWYWEGRDRSTEAFNLMRQAYELLGRYELIRILEVHFHWRNSL
jgi:hypothetical protein